MRQYAGYCYAAGFQDVTEGNAFVAFAPDVASGAARRSGKRVFWLNIFQIQPENGQIQQQEQR